MKDLGNKGLFRNTLSLLILSVICFIFFALNIHTSGIWIYLILSLLACFISIVILRRRKGQLPEALKTCLALGLGLLIFEICYALIYLIDLVTSGQPLQP